MNANAYPHEGEPFTSSPARSWVTVGRGVENSPGEDPPWALVAALGRATWRPAAGHGPSRMFHAALHSVCIKRSH
ncbi:hypothetical protein CSOJ01_13009 [Colletotrichum sojae]|uniref:Uncharacterized protein n=1 Tax=Colletotrichum sojae TaxID=2175907 RepID=A0A8H6IU58_9PEZI|nr:hypothetical protein CSOJ01_13009 [Colletotrichum sojae]